MRTARVVGLQSQDVVLHPVTAFPEKVAYAPGGPCVANRGHQWFVSKSARIGMM